MLEAGADAYTCKLPDAGELMARVRSRLCRAKGPEDHAATLYCCNQGGAVGPYKVLNPLRLDLCSCDCVLF